MIPQAPIPVPEGAPWLTAWRALFAEQQGNTLAQAATVSPSGEPEVRTVVLRGLSADGCPCFTTDLRSDKARAIRAGSKVELCIWWPERAIQMRLRGPATPVARTSGDWGPVRRALWDVQRETDRRGFAGAPPGTPLDDASPAPETDPPDPDGPHPSFAVVIVTPTRVDRLDLGDPHVRRVLEWTAGSGWEGGRVTP